VPGKKKERVELKKKDQALVAFVRRVRGNGIQASYQKGKSSKGATEACYSISFQNQGDLGKNIRIAVSCMSRGEGKETSVIRDGKIRLLPRSINGSRRKRNAPKENVPL